LAFAAPKVTAKVSNASTSTAARTMDLLSLFRRNYSAPIPGPAVDVIRNRRLIIRPEMLGEQDGQNINSPSPIRVPDWIDRPLGRYYLYFSSHGGCRYVRLAYADALDGQWRIHAEGTLNASDLPSGGRSISAPNVHVDHHRRQIRMYFNGRSTATNRSKSFVATSPNGLDFRPKADPVADFYLRAFQYRDAWYGLTKGGRLHRSPDGLSAFTKGPDVFPRIPRNTRSYNRPGSIRHVAVDILTEHAEVYYSRIGDAPERILKSRLDLGRDWRKWRAGPPQEVIHPVEPWEGADLPVIPSRFGAAHEAMHQLRDPEVFTDADGSRHLFYAVAGEHGIAMARLGRTVQSPVQTSVI
jgi:hypothetical protein